MKILAFFVSLLLVGAFGVTIPERVCSDRCQPHRQLAQAECDLPIIKPLCVVQSCAAGYKCTLPANSFLIANFDLTPLELVIEYSWSSERRDLDTSTRFHGANDGWSCHNPSQYLAWLGDNTSFGGSEHAVVDIEKARVDGVWTGSTTVQANAGWYGSEQQGEARLTVWLRTKGSNDLTVPADSVSDVIHPGVQTSCSSHHVANVDIIRGEKLTRISIAQP